MYVLCTLSLRNKDRTKNIFYLKYVADLTWGRFNWGRFYWGRFKLGTIWLEIQDVSFHNPDLQDLYKTVWLPVFRYRMIHLLCFCAFSLDKYLYFIYFNNSEHTVDFKSSLELVLYPNCNFLYDIDSIICIVYRL